MTPVNIYVEMFHRHCELVFFNDGTCAPVTNWLDSDGEDCGGFDNPVSAVAGPDVNGKWHVINAADFVHVHEH